MSHSEAKNITPHDAIPKRQLERPDDTTGRLFKKKDRVRVKTLSKSEMKELQEDHGGYNDAIGMVCLQENLFHY